MNPIGVSTWVWTSPLTDRELEILAKKTRDWGFDVIELPIENLTDWDPARTADLLERVGLSATTCAVMSTDRDLTTTDRARTSATQAYLRGCVDAAARIGSPVVAGPIYSPVARTWRMDAVQRRETIERLGEALVPLADYAGERGVGLALEPLNRFETSLINTLDQALEVIDAVGLPSLGVCLDTFHLNIEERDPAVAVVKAGRHVAHVQACGTDRGAPGSDHFDWGSFVHALRTVGFVGPVCIESFTAENDAIARAASIWRRLAPTQDQLATDGLAFLRSLFGGGSSVDAGSGSIN